MGLVIIQLFFFLIFCFGGGRKAEYISVLETTFLPSPEISTVAWIHPHSHGMECQISSLFVESFLSVSLFSLNSLTLSDPLSLPNR